MKKSLIFIIVVLMGQFASANTLPVKNQDVSPSQLRKQNKKIAQLAAFEESKNLPQVIDKYTTLQSVKNDDLTLIYTFTINTGAKSDATIQKEDHSRMKQAVTTGICQSSKKFLEAGINTSYVYRSAKTKAHLFQFDISQKDCITNIK